MMFQTVSLILKCLPYIVPNMLCSSLSVLKTDAVLWMGVQCNDPPACVAGKFSPGGGKDGGGSYACTSCPPGTFSTAGSSASVYSILTATALTISVLMRTVSLVHMYMSEVSICNVYYTYVTSIRIRWRS